MILLEDILNNILLTESVSEEEINDAMDNHKRIIINYHTKGEDNNTGARVIEVYAYGLTKAGNPVLRAFQPYGDTTTRVPSWKFFRLDRISEWQPTKQTFNRPADFYYKNIGKFNPNGDETMSVVYKIIDFNNQGTQNTFNSEPKTKQDIYKTDTEHRMERLRQQLNNPIKLSDIKDGNNFKQIQNKEIENSGPKTKQDIKKPSSQTNLFKTDTEIGMERLRQQLNNPRKIDLTQFERKPKRKTPEEQQKELDKLRQTLKDKESMTLADLNKAMQDTDKQETKPNQSKLFKTDTERNLDRLRQQLQNPRRIDLSKIPRK